MDVLAVLGVMVVLDVFGLIALQSLQRDRD
jgi:hypothetical protein